jgi:hypothetical protein
MPSTLNCIATMTSEDHPQQSSADPQTQIAELKASLDALSDRVRDLESVIKADHTTLTEDHRKIETLELTGKVTTRPVGL